MMTGTRTPGSSAMTVKIAPSAPMVPSVSAAAAVLRSHAGNKR